jgi:Flp pilus assembly protein TadD
MDEQTMWQQAIKNCLAAGLLVTLFGCASSTQQAQLPVIEQHRELLRGAAFFPVDEPLPVLEPARLLAVNDDMRAFLNEHVPNRRISAEMKSRRILRALLSEGLDLQYSNLKTLTAEETFYAREGNCMSFTNLFIALAREVGIVASYQEVAVPPSWSAVGDTHYFSLHLNVIIDLPRKQQIVDFDTQTNLKRAHPHPVGDGTAAAQFYNNMAVYYMTSGDLPTAYLNARKAIEMRPETGYFWANLGTIFRRANDFERAEEAYLAAIEISKEPTAMSNLARLYRRAGMLDLADSYAARVEVYRAQNPYYLYKLAQVAYAQGNYLRVSELMASAIKKRKDEHDFYRLQGLAWARLGEVDKAEQSFELAMRYATDAGQTHRYNHKLELLARSGH